MKISCPDEERIIDYLEGRLKDPERAVLEEHISLCDPCRQELIIGNGLVRNADNIKTDPVPEHVTQSAIDLANNHYAGPGISFMEMCKECLNNLRGKMSDLIDWVSLERWGLQPVRGSNRVIFENLIRLKRNFKDLKAEIEIERIGIKDVNIIFRILNYQSRENGIRITLFRGQREVSSLLIDAAGLVIFENMPFGHYGLVVARDGIILGDYYFDIAGSHYGKRGN